MFRFVQRSKTWKHAPAVISKRYASVKPQPPENHNTVCLYKCIDPLVPYSLAHRWMDELVSSKGRPENPEKRDVLFVVQHKPVYTLGKAATEEHVKFPIGPDCPFEIHRIERGGEVTYHGPGQLTIYPILNLKNYKKDLHWYVAQLESLVIEILAKYGIEAGIDPANPGVWIGDAKIAALGCKFSRWVTMHGFALNVHLPCLHGFNRIVPCGITDKSVVTMEQFDDSVTLEKVSDEIVKSFEKVFNATVVEDFALTQYYDTQIDNYYAEQSQVIQQ